MNEGFWIKDFHCFAEGGELYDGFYKVPHRFFFFLLNE